MPKQLGLDHRRQDNNGRIRAKNGNTRIDTLRETYGDNFAQAIRGDAHLSTLLERTDAHPILEEMAVALQAYSLTIAVLMHRLDLGLNGLLRPDLRRMDALV